MKRGNIILCCFSLAFLLPIYAQKVDYSVPYVQEERGFDLVQVSRDNDYVAMPIVKRNKNGVQWLTNSVLAASPNGKEIAYLSLRDGNTNIFIKDIDKHY